MMVAKRVTKKPADFIDTVTNSVVTGNLVVWYTHSISNYLYCGIRLVLETRLILETQLTVMVDYRTTMQ